MTVIKVHPAVNLIKTEHRCGVFFEVLGKLFFLKLFMYVFVVVLVFFCICVVFYIFVDYLCF